MPRWGLPSNEVRRTGVRRLRWTSLIDDEDALLLGHRRMDRQHRDGHIRISKLRAAARNIGRNPEAHHTGLLRSGVSRRSGPLESRGIAGGVRIRMPSEI